MADKYLCISKQDYEKFGCPHCADKNGAGCMETHKDTILWRCIECHGMFLVVGGDDKSAISIGNCQEGWVTPSVRKHPFAPT